MRAAYRYLRRNPSLALGLVLLAALGLFVLIGNLVAAGDQEHWIGSWHQITRREQ